MIVDIQVQGLRAWRDHLAIIADFTNVATVDVLDALGEMVVESAVGKVRVLSGATRDSISYIPPGVMGEGGDYSIEAGPTTLQARFLEGGFVHWRTGNLVGPYPFMGPALDEVTPVFIDAMTQIAAFPATAQPPFLSGAGAPVASAMGSSLSRFRSHLYTAAKFLGDVQVFAGSPAISSVRSVLYGSARAIGDVQSTMRGAMAQRVSRRVTGRFSGLGISATRSAFISGPGGGPAAQRIYNRIAGRATAPLVRRGPSIG